MNKKITFGFDIDGVLLDCESYMTQKGCIYLNKPVLNPAGGDIAEIFGVSKELQDAFWRDHIEDFAVMPVARVEMKNLINKLRQEGVKVFIITNRGQDLSFCKMKRGQMQQLVKIWLQKHQIEYDGLCFANGDKSACCQEKQVNIFVEDAPKVITLLLEGCSNVNDVLKPDHILCYDASYNKTVQGEKITRVKNAQDIYEFYKNWQAKN